MIGASEDGDFLDGSVSDGRFIFDAESHDRLTALKEVSFVVEPGEFLSIMGPSGSG